MQTTELKAHPSDNLDIRQGNFLQYQSDIRQLKLYTTKENKWVLEENGEKKFLKHGDELKLLQGGNWKYIADDQSTITIEPSDLEISIEVSPDYEHVSVAIAVEDRQTHLPAKAMNYPLYLMAKQMLDDCPKAEYSVHEKGWMNTEHLVRLLQREMCNPEIDVYYLNVQIYRLRKAISKTQYGALLDGLIERRHGQVRFNHSNFSIREYKM